MEKAYFIYFNFFWNWLQSKIMHEDHKKSFYEQYLLWLQGNTLILSPSSNSSKQMAHVSKASCPFWYFLCGSFRKLHFDKPWRRSFAANPRNYPKMLTWQQCNVIKGRLTTKKIQKQQTVDEIVIATVTPNTIHSRAKSMYTASTTTLAA